VAAEIVHHDDIVRGEFRNENLLDISEEGSGIDRAIEDQRRDHAGEPEAGEEGGCFPVAVRDGRSQPLALWRSALEPCHIG